MIGSHTQPTARIRVWQRDITPFLFLSNDNLRVLYTWWLINETIILRPTQVEFCESFLSSAQSANKSVTAWYHPLSRQASSPHHPFVISICTWFYLSRKTKFSSWSNELCSLKYWLLEKPLAKSMQWSANSWNLKCSIPAIKLIIWGYIYCNQRKYSCVIALF